MDDVDRQEQTELRRAGQADHPQRLKGSRCRSAGFRVGRARNLLRRNLANPANKITAALLTAQSLASGGIIATATVLTIVATDLSGSESLAGVPWATMQLASAPAAFFWGLLWDRLGRRNGLVLGAGFGILGLALALVAVETGSFLVLLAGLIGLGFSHAAVQLGRFVAAEVHPPQTRGRALSIVVWGATVGAVGGPLLVAPSGRVASMLGLAQLSGPFLAGALLYLLAMLAMWVWLRPEPMQLSRQVARDFPEPEINGGKARPLGEILRQPAVLVGISAMVFGRAVMVLVMGITALYMKHVGHELGNISVVFSAHTLGMFAFSVVSGWLADRWGRSQLILSGTLLMLVSAGLSPYSPNLMPISAGLFLLGLGWNFCFVGGSALLSDQLAPAERSRTQGLNDLLASLVSAAASFSAGFIYATQGYPVLNLIGAALVLLPLSLTAWWFRRQRRVVTELAGS